jgi:transcriptional regulator with XRE-family HTH domain
VAKRRRFSEDGFGDTVQRLMDEVGVTYRQLASRTGLSAGYLNHLVHGNRPVPSNDVVVTLAKALEVEPEHFREYRVRMITERLEAMPALIDRLYRQLHRRR